MHFKHGCVNMIHRDQCPQINHLCYITLHGKVNLNLLLLFVYLNKQIKNPILGNKYFTQVYK